MNGFLQQFGLEVHPYEIRELNPLTRKDDAKRLIRISSFKEVDSINDYLAEMIGGRAAAFFLVTGRDGSGRSSVANYILSRYRDARGLGSTTFFVPQRGTGHNDEFSILRNWMSDLYEILDDAKVPFEAQFLHEFKSTIRNVTRDTMEIEFPSVARRLGGELAALPEPGGYGLCLENVTAPSIIKAAISIFRRAQTVCVFEVGDYADSRRQVVECFDDPQIRAERRKVRLLPVRGPEAAAIADERWTLATEGAVENPFNLDGVRNAFDDRERSVKRLMWSMEKLLKLKALEHLGREAWPGNRDLYFSAEELPLKVKFLDENPFRYE